MIRPVFLAAMAAVLGSAGVAAAAPALPAGLEGRWVLDVAHSDYGEFPGPNAATLDIRRDGAVLHLRLSATTRRSTRSYDLALPTDGREVRYPLQADIRVGSAILRSASVVFKGSALAVVQRVQHMDEMVLLQTTFSRSAGVLREQMVQDGAVMSTLVFRRAGGTDR